MKKPKLLDLYCGAGGATRGYQMAGFYVVGVDHKPQPHYVGDEFVLADALEYVRCTGGHEFDVIHASPPCQAYTRAQSIQNRQHPRMIDDVRIALMSLKRPWIIENVVGAPLVYSVILCGTMFNLKVYRHRLFESSILLLQPECHHPSYLMDGFVSVYGNVVRGRQTGNRGNHYKRYTVAYAQQAMGIDWMTRDELREAIPPAYTEFIGKQLYFYSGGAWRDTGP